MSTQGTVAISQRTERNEDGAQPATGSRDVDAWIDLLQKDVHASRRREAARELGRIAFENQPGVIRALHKAMPGDAHPLVREAAREALIALRGRYSKEWDGSNVRFGHRVERVFVTLRHLERVVDRHVWKALPVKLWRKRRAPGGRLPVVLCERPRLFFCEFSALLPMLNALLRNLPEKPSRRVVDTLRTTQGVLDDSWFEVYIDGANDVIVLQAEPP